MSMVPVVIKVGGNDLEKPGFVPELVETVRQLRDTYAPVVVHGGGRAIDALMESLGITPQYVDGQRVTDEATLRATMMVLCGQVNKALTVALLQEDIDAIGISGIDRRLLTVEPWNDQMGLVGRIIQVRTEVLRDLCVAGVVPVVSPISIGPAGAYNVNADHAAGAIAGALAAEYAAFITNVPGVKIGEQVAPQLTKTEVHDLIAQDIIIGGMIPKVHAALAALEQGVKQVVITDLGGLRASTGTLLTA